MSSNAKSLPRIVSEAEWHAARDILLAEEKKLTRARDAQRRPSRLRAAPLATAAGWLERYRAHWEQSFQRLDAVLKELEHVSATKKPPRRKPR